MELMQGFSGLMKEMASEANFEEIKTLTPKDYYEMDSSSKLQVHLKISFLELHGLLNSNEELDRLSYQTHHYKWQATKGGEELLFTNREEARKHFNLKIIYQGNYNGYLLKRIDVTKVVDSNGNVLEKTYKKAP